MSHPCRYCGTELYGDEGDEGCTETAELTNARRDLAKLREALRLMVWRNDNATAAFEELADRFRRDTGFTAPGKSVPLKWGHESDDDDRQDAWRKWRAKVNDEEWAQLRALASVQAPKLEPDHRDATIAKLREALADVLTYLPYQDNGVHYCRWCDGGTHNGWKHAPNCYFEKARVDREAARERAIAALASVQAPSETKTSE